jgi:hypothetical protein
MLTVSPSRSAPILVVSFVARAVARRHAAHGNCSFCSALQRAAPLYAAICRHVPLHGTRTVMPASASRALFRYSRQSQAARGAVRAQHRAAGFRNCR